MAKHKVDSKLILAYDTMITAIESGTEFAVAHERAMVKWSLTPAEAVVLIAWYDQGDDN